MFDHLLENRNSTVTNLIKLSDCLGRSLRENVELFSIDSEKCRAAFLCESGKVITGEYDLAGDILFGSIVVQDTDVFSDNRSFDDYVNEKVSNFIGNINADNYSEAEDSFTDVLSLWENRLKFENVKNNLKEKACAFSTDNKIVETAEFQRFLEVMPQFVKFLSEEKETIEQVKEIENAVKLSQSVSQAFNFPKISLEELQENASYTISKGLNKSIYELICKQELVTKELLESKRNFEDVWATNAKIRAMGSLLYEDSQDVVLEALVDAILEVPYLALATKKQLTECLNNSLSITESAPISEKDIKTFASELFEMKKPLKTVILSLLNEKYGINVQNLKETATFSSLAKTQVVIFEALSRLAPKGSVVKETLSELASMLKTKNGVEVIDINDLLKECFESCDYENFEDVCLIEDFSFSTLLDENFNAAQLLEKAKKYQKEKLLLDKDKKKSKKGDEAEIPAAGDDSHLTQDQQDARATAAKAEEDPENDEEEEDDSVKIAKKNDKKSSKKKQEEVKEEADTASAPAETEASEEDPGGETEQDKPLSKDEFLDALKDLDDLMKGMEDEKEEPPTKDENGS